MNKMLPFIGVLLLLLAVPARAAVNVFACEPEWAALAEEVGGEKVSAFAATTAFQDPHHIEARPSLIARMRRADLLVCSGAGLEAGWLPLLLRQSGNRRVQPGRPGYLEASAHVDRLEILSTLDRAMGDVHAEGNPHIHLDPRRLASIAQVLTERLAAIDPGNANAYRERLDDFRRRWAEAVPRWEAAAGTLRGTAVMAHHKDWAYLADWLGLKIVATLEPKPGLPPTAAHLAKLKQVAAGADVRMVLRAAYQSERASEWLERNTGIPAVELPYTVGGTAGADDLFGLFEDTIDRLTGARE